MKQTGTAFNEGIERNPALGRLLRESVPDGQLLSWERLSAIVESAAPVRLSWWQRLLSTPRVLRYSLAPLSALLVAVGTLWVLPAQSEQAGTLICVSLPNAWHDDSSLIAEVQRHAEAELASLDVPQSQLFTMVSPRQGRDELIFAALSLRQSEAQLLLDRLNARYPMLAAFQAELIDIPGSPAANRLLQLVQQVKHSAIGGGHDQQTLARQVLEALQAAGLQDLDVKVTPQADGSLLIEVEAAFSMKVDGHLQEKLAASGVGPGASGKAGADQLLDALNAAQSQSR